MDRRRGNRYKPAVDGSKLPEPRLGRWRIGQNSVIHYTFAISNRAFDITSIKINGSAASSLVAGADSLLGRML
jgi:hypothetical protein